MSIPHSPLSLPAPAPSPAFTPVPRKHTQPAARGWTPQVQAAFLAHLAATGSVALSARAVRRSREGAYHLRAAPGAASFAAAWDSALQHGITALKAAAFDRALHGTQETVWHAGQAVGTRTRYNNQLTMRLLTHYDRQPQNDGQPVTAQTENTPEIEARLKAQAKSVETRTEAERERHIQWAQAKRIHTNLTLLTAIEAMRKWIAIGGPDLVHQHLNRIETNILAHTPTTRLLNTKANATKTALKPLENQLHATRTQLYVEAGIID